MQGIAAQFMSWISVATWVMEGLYSISNLIIQLTPEIKESAIPLRCWVIGPKEDKKVYAYGIEKHTGLQFLGCCRIPIRSMTYSVNNFEIINIIYILVDGQWYSCSINDSLHTMVKYLDMVLSDSDIPFKTGNDDLLALLYNSME